ncbi:hypothetical protein [Streptomyces capoamus]|nr:hypothetical protein [Streptomyces capoamus]
MVSLPNLALLGYELGPAFDYIRDQMTVTREALLAICIPKAGGQRTERA